jgi:hypothetical protein
MSAATCSTSLARSSALDLGRVDALEALNLGGVGATSPRAGQPDLRELARISHHG